MSPLNAPLDGPIAKPLTPTLERAARAFPPKAIWGADAARNLSLASGAVGAYRDAFNPARDVDLSSGHDFIAGADLARAKQGSRSGGGNEPIEGWEAAGMDYELHGSIDYLSGPTSGGVLFLYAANVDESVRLMTVLGDLKLFVRSGGTTEGEINLGAYVPSQRERVAWSLRAGELKASRNGSTTQIDHTVDMPVGLRTLDIGIDHAGNRLNGGLIAAALFPGAATNDALESLSS